MDFRFNEEQRALQDAVRRFVEKEMPKEKVAEWDRDEEFPRDLLAKMADIGLMGATISEQYGGSGGGVMEEVIVLEELARHSSTVALAYGLDVCFGAVTLERHGAKTDIQSVSQGDGGTVARQLLQHDHFFHHAAAGAAILFRDRRAHQTDVGHLGQQVARELFIPVPLGHLLFGHFLFHETPHGILQRPLLFVESKVHKNPVEWLVLKNCTTK